MTKMRWDRASVGTDWTRTDFGFPSIDGPQRESERQRQEALHSLSGQAMCEWLAEVIARYTHSLLFDQEVYWSLKDLSVNVARAFAELTREKGFVSGDDLLRQVSDLRELFHAVAKNDI
jgi:hypothetical protein